MKIIRLAILAAHASALFGAYQYYQSDTFSSLNSTNWWVNGGAVATSQGLSSNGNAALISNLAIPDSSWDYEVKITLNLADNSVGDLLPVIYLRDQGNPLDSAAFWYYAIEIDASSSTGSCSYSVYKHYTDSGGVHDVFIASGGGGCHNGLTIRAVVYTAPSVDAFLGIFIDDPLAASIIDSPGATYGPAGVGLMNGCQSGCGGSISRVDIGPKDRVNPNPVNVASIGTTVWANRMDAQWTAATDDPNGIGVAIYGISRNGTFIAYPGSTSYSDPTLVPGTTYAYTVYAIDFHGNWSTGAGFSVTTPGTHPNPAIAIPPARTGVRPTGAYWGAGGEQIDTLSGNLNFNLPLLKAKGRGGSAVTLGLSYNSQLWRQDPGGTWGYGVDVGFGFGWKLMGGIDRRLLVRPIYTRSLRFYGFEWGRLRPPRQHKRYLDPVALGAQDPPRIAYGVTSRLPRAEEKKLYFASADWAPCLGQSCDVKAGKGNPLSKRRAMHDVLVVARPKTCHVCRPPRPPPGFSLATLDRHAQGVTGSRRCGQQGSAARSRAQSYPFQLIYKPAVGIQSITYPGSNRVVTATYA